MIMALEEDIVDDHYISSSSDDDDDSTSVEVAFDDIVNIVYLNSILLLLLLATYNTLRRRIPSIYMGRNDHVSAERRVDAVPYSAWNPLNFVPSVLKVSWRDVRVICGLDQYMFLRFVHMCSTIVCVSSVWAAIILYPIYYYGDESEVQEGWYLLSMANLAKGSKRLWCPTVFMYLFSAFTTYVMDREYRHYVELRNEWLGRGEPDIPTQHNYSLMVEKIPPDLRSDRALYDYFNAIFPGKVYSANVLVQAPDLESRMKRRNEVMKRLEKANAFLAASGRRPTHRNGKHRCRCCGIECAPYSLKDSVTVHEIIDYNRNENSDDPDTLDINDEVESFRKGERVDSVRYYEKMLQYLNIEVQDLQREKIRICQEGNETHNVTNWFSSVLRWSSGHDNNNISSLASTFEQQSEEGTHGDLMSRSDMEELSMLSMGQPLIREKVKLIDHARPGIELESLSYFKMIFYYFGGTFFISRIEMLKKKYDVVVDSVTTGSGLSSVGFVTFKDLTTVTAAANATFTTEPNTLLLQVAPEPRDIHWVNAVKDADAADAKQRSGDALVAMGAILWSIPVAAIQVWFTADSLSEVKGFEWMSESNNEAIATFVNAWLPVTTLMLLMSVLPYVFEWIGKKYEGRKTYSDIEESIARRYFLYQLANVYITVSSYSIFDSLNDIIDDPGDTTKLLGETLPTVVGYFVALLVTKTLVGVPMGLLRTGALARYGLLRSMFCSKKYLTQRELDVVYKRLRLKYGREYPSVLLAIIICQCYAVIAPVILPFGAIYFASTIVVYKMQCLHVFTTKYESGGILFPIASHRLLVGLIFAQLTLIGYLGLREGYVQATFLSPVVVFTYRRMKYFYHQYQLPSMYVTMEQAQYIDKQDIEVIRRQEFDANAYRQPVLTERLAEPQPYRRNRDNM